MKIYKILSLMACILPMSSFADSYKAQDILIESRGAQIPVHIVTPDDDDKAPLVVLAHGYGSTKEEAGAFTKVAEELAKEGIASISIDFAGCGKSTESFTQYNITNMIADIQSAANYMQQNYPIDAKRQGILGFSFGGRLASIMLGQGTEFKTAVMWAPSSKKDVMASVLGGIDAKNKLYAQAQAEGYADFTTSWGAKQQLSTQLFDEAENIDVYDAISKFKGNFLIINGGQDQSVTPSEVDALVAAASNAQLIERLYIPSAGHTFGLYDAPNFIDIVIERTVDYFEEQLDD